MSERSCTEPSCCNGTQWPHCAQTAGMPRLIKPGYELRGEHGPELVQWEATGSPYSHYEESDPTPWRYTYPATD